MKSVLFSGSLNDDKYVLRPYKHLGQNISNQNNRELLEVSEFIQSNSVEAKEQCKRESDIIIAKTDKSEQKDENHAAAQNVLKPESIQTVNNFQLMASKDEAVSKNKEVITDKFEKKDENHAAAEKVLKPESIQTEKNVQPIASTNQYVSENNDINSFTGKIRSYAMKFLKSMRSDSDATEQSRKK